MYRCEGCRQVSRPGKPRLLHVFYRPGTKDVLREVAVCERCKSELEAGVTLSAIVTRTLREQEAAQASPPPEEPEPEQPQPEVRSRRPAAHAVSF